MGKIILLFVITTFCFNNQFSETELLPLSETRNKVTITENYFVTLNLEEYKIGDKTNYCYFLSKHNNSQNLIWKSEGLLCEPIIDSSRIIELINAIDDGYIVYIWLFGSSLFLMHFNDNGELVWESHFSDMGHKSYAWGIEIVDREYTINYRDPSSKGFKLLRIDKDGQIIQKR